MKTLHHHDQWPFLRLLAPFAGGISLALMLPANSFAATLLADVLLLASLVFTCIFYRRWNLWRYKKTTAGLVFLFLLCAGFTATVWHTQISRPDHFSKFPGRQMRVQVCTEPVLSGKYLRFCGVVKAIIRDGSEIRTCGKISITVKNTAGKTGYAYGDELLLPANFREIQAPLNPAGFNYKRYLRYQQISHQAFPNPENILVLSSSGSQTLIGYALQVRRKMVAKLARHIRDREAVAVASTLLLGYRATLSDETLSAYSRTGTLHVLSVSGMHVALLYWIIARMLVLFGQKKAALFCRALLSLLLIWGYALLTGFSPSVNRAAFMLSFFIIGKSFNRNSASLNILAFSAFALLLYNPYYLADVGFQLSYLAVGGLIVLQPAIGKLLAIRLWPVKLLWQACSVSLAAQMATTPLSLYYFHQFPLYFLLCNLLIIILSTVIMYSGIFFLLLPADGVLTRFAAAVLEKTIVLTNHVLAAIEHWPVSAIDRVWISLPELFILSAFVMAGSSLIIFRKRKYVFAMLLLLCFFCAARSVRNIRTASRSEMVIFSVRKQYAIAFRWGKQALVCTDMNQSSPSFRYAVQPFLDSSGIRKTFFYPPFPISSPAMEQTASRRLLIINRYFIRQKKPGTLRADAVFITGNPYIGLDELRRCVSFKWLILGNNNSDRLIQKLSAEASRSGIPFYCLKDRFALRFSTN